MGATAATLWTRVVRRSARLWVGLGRGWRRVSGLWRRSIQVRVIGSTLVLSVVVVLLLGLVLLRQVTDGLVAGQADAAVNDASAGLNRVQQQLAAAEVTDEGALDQLLNDVVTEQFDRAGEDARFEVLMLNSERGWEGTIRRSPGNPTVDSVPVDLRAAVARSSDTPQVQWAYTEIHWEDPGRAAEPGLVVGAQVSVPLDSTYEMYYVFSTREQQQTIDLVQRALLSAGLLLVVLLGAIAALITRQAVTPVRIASEAAGRLGRGNLDERMPETRQDELAALASGFNHMAVSIQQQISQLEALSRMQQQFVSDVSHELRTPLTTVRMAADVIHDAREELDDPVVARSAELLHTQLDRFEDLLGELLEISRFDAGAAVLTTESVDVRDLVRWVVDGAAPLAVQKGSPVTCVMPETGVVVDVDARRVQRVLRNLVVNAIEHGEGEPVVVEVAENDRAVAIGVRDHGVGLKPGESSLVFRRFWRADPARARTTGGTGLGLSIAIEDTRLHGGWLHAWGEPGRGSWFRLTLPRTPGGEILESPLPTVPADAGQHGDADVGDGSSVRTIGYDADHPGPGEDPGGEVGQDVGTGRTDTDGPGQGAASRAEEVPTRG